jgi:hypothetical protein
MTYDVSFEWPLTSSLFLQVQEEPMDKDRKLQVIKKQGLLSSLLLVFSIDFNNIDDVGLILLARRKNVTKDAFVQKETTVCTGTLIIHMVLCHSC